MGRCILYIATSLDGYIAGPRDEIGWLERFAAPGEDYGYAAFLRTVGSAVMGARTYEESLAHPERLLTALTTYVFTSRPLPAPPAGRVVFVRGEPGRVLARIRRAHAKHIYLVGGGLLASAFMARGLVDELRLFVAPVLLGRGRPLFAGLPSFRPLKFLDSRAYASGLVRLRYARPAEKSAARPAKSPRVPSRGRNPPD